jgi:ribulose-5-phosphate 4-epimerase/fuculose-1-phosphate aldolase
MTKSTMEARIELAAALRLACREGLHEGVCNHFSVVVPGSTDRFLINPNRMHWSMVRASDLVMLDNDGQLIEGAEPPEATAFYIHWRLHRAAPHARAILHTHMPYATALCCLEDPALLPVSQSALLFHGDVAYERDYNGLAVDEAEGDRMCAALGNKSVLFLANHGVMVTGASVAEAFNKLYYLERACMHQVMALATGRPLKHIRQEVAEKTRQQVAEDSEMAPAHFQAMLAVLDRECPDYKD